MEKLHTGQIAHAFEDKKVYSIRLPKGDYLLFILNAGFKLKKGDSIGYYNKWGTQSMYHVVSGDSFSATVEAIGISASEVESFAR